MFSSWNSTINESFDEGNSRKGCVLKYQQSQIEVYARFVISSPGQSTEYFRSRKTLVMVTDMVKDHISTEDSSIARIFDMTVQGVSPGMTSVQVLLILGWPMYGIAHKSEIKAVEVLCSRFDYCLAVCCNRQESIATCVPLTV